MSPPRQPRVRTNRFGMIVAALLALALIGYAIQFLSIPSRIPPQEQQTSGQP
jgi:hypothetical protein